MSKQIRNEALHELKFQNKKNRKLNVRKILAKLSKQHNDFIDLSSLFPIGRAPMDVWDFIRQVDRVYRGLGIPTLYGVLSVLANKSVFFISGTGTGKTRIINLIPSIEGTKISNWDTFTLEELNNHFGNISCNGPVRNKHLLFKVQEFSTLSDYHREVFLTVCSKIVSDGNYRHVTKHMPYLDIQDCKLTLLIAIQPRLYSLLCNRYTQWESMSTDRFTKFLLLNPIRQGTVDVPLIATLPREINRHVVFSRNEVDLEKLVVMFRGHVSEGRAEIYAKDYAIALAGFVGANKVEQKHIDTFYNLFHPYLESFSVLQKAEDLDSPVMVRSGYMKLLSEIGKHLDVTTKNQLARSLYVTDRSIERGAKHLIEKGLIQKPRAATYCLSENLTNFFRWYNNKLDFPS